MILSSNKPLTLILSHWEREQQSLSCETFNRARFANRLTMILPLPGGEGRGEGEGIALKET